MRKKVEKVPEGAAAPSPPPSEMEVKFRAGPEVQRDILNSPLLAAATDRVTEELETTYFDTAHSDLHEAGIDLRIRREGDGRRILTCKGAPSAANPFARMEIEAETTASTPVLALFPDAVAARIREAAGGARLKARFHTRITRQSCRLRHGTAEIELACDVGSVTAGKRSHAIGEFELELLSGDSVDLLNLTTACAAQFPLTLDFVSKSAKGHLLLSRALPLSCKAAAPDLAEARTGSDVIAALLANALQHFTANWQALRNTEAPEAVHQLRVALRRLRCFLAFIPRSGQEDRATGFRRRARDISARFAAARGWDVFEDFLVKGPFATPLAGATALLRRLKDFRQTALAEARAALDSRETTLFVLDLHAYIAARGWEQETSISEVVVASLDAETFAAQTIERLQAKARKRGRKIAAQDAAALHELRIALKALRYGAEALGAIAGKRKRVRTLLEIAAHLQDILGQRNDATQFTQHLQQLAAATGSKANAATAFAAGWLGRLEAEDRSPLHKAWQDFKDLNTRWT